MNDATFDLDQADAETLIFDVSDETLEATATAEGAGRTMTLMYYSCGSCPR